LGVEHLSLPVEFGLVLVGQNGFAVDVTCGTDNNGSQSPPNELSTATVQQRQLSAENTRDISRFGGHEIYLRGTKTNGWEPAKNRSRRLGFLANDLCIPVTQPLQKSDYIASVIS
jgi:hypothetical protein